MKNLLIGIIIGALLTTTITLAQTKVSAIVEENPCNTCLEGCKELCKK